MLNSVVFPVGLFKNRREKAKEVHNLVTIVTFPRTKRRPDHVYVLSGRTQEGRKID